MIAALIVCPFYLYATLTRAAFMLSRMVGGECLISCFISQMGERTYIDANGVELGGMEALRQQLTPQRRLQLKLQRSGQNKRFPQPVPPETTSPMSLMATSSLAVSMRARLAYPIAQHMDCARPLLAASLRQDAPRMKLPRLQATPV